MQSEDREMNELNQIDRVNVRALGELYFAESRSEHADESPEEEKRCKGCRKMKLALQLLSFADDFGD